MAPISVRATTAAEDVKLILDDRAGLAEQLGFDGVHVGMGSALQRRPAG